MELVTKDNLDFTRPVKLTESGLELWIECETYNNEIFYLHEDNKHFYNEDSEWHVLKVNNNSNNTIGIRIGENNIYDAYYPEIFDIEEIINNLNKLETKLKTK